MINSLSLNARSTKYERNLKENQHVPSFHFAEVKRYRSVREGLLVEVFGVSPDER